MTLANHAPDARLETRLCRPGPKRLLALDGGGVRGLISLGYLSAIEALLRDRYRDPDYTLSDYFDLIGGTSTGSLIGTLLALGWPVGKITNAYLELAERVFRPNHYWGLGPIGRALSDRFSAVPLEEILEQFLGQTTLDSPRLRTGLLVVMKRIDTASVWPVVNIPGSRFFDDRPTGSGGLSVGNRHFLLRDILRAATAAPTFFRPKRIGDVGVLQPAVFVDGAISTHNNPALMTLMAATLDGFGLRWILGPDQMLLCSVGTGHFSRTAPVESVERFSNLDWAQLLLPQLIGDSMEFVESLLQWMSVSPTARPIDRVIGTAEPKLNDGRGLLRVLRYNLSLTLAELDAIGVSLEARQMLALRDMSNVNSIPHLLDVSRRVGSSVNAEHFSPGFDRPRAP